jgi:hypothetical protein
MVEQMQHNFCQHHGVNNIFHLTLNGDVSMKSMSESKSFSMICRALLIMFAFAGVGLLAACDNDGPAEEMGEKIDNTVEDAGDAIDDAADDAGDAIEDSADEVEDATDK